MLRDNAFIVNGNSKIQKVDGKTITRLIIKKRKNKILSEILTHSLNLKTLNRGTLEYDNLFSSHKSVCPLDFQKKL